MVTVVTAPEAQPDEFVLFVQWESGKAVEPATHPLEVANLGVIIEVTVPLNPLNKIADVIIVELVKNT